MSSFLKNMYRHAAIGVLFLLVWLMPNSRLFAQMSGSYTIDPSLSASSTNFQSFTAAVTALASSGVSGAVTIKVADGTYTEKISIGAISGTSASKAVTFESASGNNTKVILTKASETVSTNNYTLQLNGADYVIFKNITISRTGTNNYARVIDIRNTSVGNQFINNNLIGINSAVYASDQAVVYSHTGSNDNYNVLKTNVIRYGSYGIHFAGISSSSQEKGTVIQGNVIDSATYRGISIEHQDSLTITGNTIKNLQEIEAEGLLINDAKNYLTITSNKVNLPQGYLGFLCAECRGTASKPAIIANNFITVGVSDYNVYGMEVENSQHVKIIYNSVHVYDTFNNSAALYMTTASGSTYGNVTVKNNSFVNSEDGYALYVTSAAVTNSFIDSADYNNYYTTGSVLGYWGSTSVADLSALKTASSKNANSISADPKYIADDDLHVLSTSPLEAKATPWSAISKDIDGNLRDASTPDIGADEFKVYAHDLKIVKILSPVNLQCGDSNTVLAVVVANDGSSSQSSYTLKATVTSDGVTTNLSKTITGTFATDDKDTVIFSTVWNTYNGDTLDIVTYTELSSEENRVNDTAATIAYIYGGITKPTARDTFRCGAGSVTMIAKGTAGNTIKWYTTEFGGTAIHSGDTLTTSLSTTTTYYIEQVNSGGCASPRISRTATIYPQTAPKISGDSVVCMKTNGFIYSTTNVSGNTYNWTVTGGTIVSGSGTNSIKVNWGSSGTGKVKLNEYNSKCSAADSINITINSKPAPAISGATTVCGTGPFTYSTSNNAGNMYSWSITGGSFSGSSNSNSVTVNWSSTSGTLSVRETNMLGCDSLVTISVSINAKPKADFTLSNVCFNQSVSFTNSSSISSGSITSYLWRFGDNTTSTSASPTKNYSAAGTYTVWLVATSNNGCKDSISKTVTVYPRANVNFTASNTCFGESLSFTNSTTVSSGSITSYLWKFGDNTTSTATSPTKKYSAAGTYTVTLIATTNNGCSDSVKKSVTIYPKPAASFTYINRCQDSSLSFTSTSSVSSGSVSSYYWDFGDGITSTLTSANTTHAFSAAGIYKVMHVAITSNGCRDTVYQNVEAYALPQVSFTSSGNSCLYSAVDFTNTTTIASGFSVSTYMWDFGDGNKSSSVSPQHKYAAAGKYTVSLTAISNKGCMAKTSQTVTIFAVPEASFTATTTCQGNTTQFTNTSIVLGQTGILYNWNFGDGKTSTDKSPVHAFSKGGIYEVTLIAKNNNGCADTFKSNVTVYHKPVAAFGASKACAGQQMMFTDSSTIDATDSIIAYNWSFGDGNTSTAANPRHIYANAGFYNVSLVVTSSNGCTDTLEKQIRVFTVPSVAISTADVCDGQAAQFTSSVTSTTYNYIWSFGDGDSAFVKTTTHTYSAPGTYNVTLTITNANGCASSLSQQVIVKPRPVAGFEVADACMSQAAVFTNTSAVAGDSIATYSWNFGDGKTSTDKAPVHKYTSAGTFDVSLIVTTYGGCSDTFTKSLIIHPQPVADFTSTTVCEGDATMFTDASTVSTGNIAAYSWNFGDGNTSADTSPSHTYAIAGTYQVKLVVSTNNGCMDSVTKTVTVNALPTLTVSHVTNERNVKFMVSDSSYTEYHWSFGDTKTSTDKNPLHRYADTGHYSVFVTVTNASGCSQTFTDTVHVFANAIAHEQPKQNFHMKLYPNPYKQKAVLEYSLEKRATVRAAVYDVQGREVEVIVDNVDQITGNYRYIIGTTKAIKAGVYFVRMTVDGSVTTQQLIRVE